MTPAAQATAEATARTPRAVAIRRRLVPYFLLGPGILWLILFFVVPMYYMGRLSLESGLFPSFHFDWNFANYSDAISAYDTQLFRSFRYSAAATVIALLIAYPLAYAIAFRGGKYKNAMLLAVVAPFFTTYLIRTLAWETILSDNGVVVDTLRSLGLVSSDGRVLATSGAVIAGLTYNFLPFMILPIYASLERMDVTLIEAAKDLYASSRKAFWKVTLPISLPGVVAGTLLTFIPATGDYINAQFLGGAQNSMIGNVIQSLYLKQSDYPSAAALSFTLMAIMLVIVFIYIRFAGSEALMGEEAGSVRAAWKWLRHNALIIYGCLAIAYMLIPIALIVVFSFNDPSGKFNFTWEGFTLDHWKDPFAIPELSDALVLSLKLAALATVIATVLGTMIALAMVRYSFFGRRASNYLIVIPTATPEIVLGASLLSMFLIYGLSLGFTTLIIAHVMFCISFVVIVVRSRLIGFDRSLEEAAQDLGADPFTTFRKITLPLIMPGIVGGALLAFALSIDDFVVSNFVAGDRVTFPLYIFGAAQRGIPVEVYVIATMLFIVTVLAMVATVWQQRRAERMTAGLAGQEGA